MFCTAKTEGALDLACTGWGKLVIWFAASGLVAVLRERSGCGIGQLWDCAYFSCV